MSDHDPSDSTSFDELRQLVRHLGDELASFRRRTFQAEARVKALEAAGGVGELASHERLAEVEAENADLRRRLGVATERTQQVLTQLRFLRQQHEQVGSDR